MYIIELVIDHVQDNVAAYAIGTVVGLAILVIFRRVAIPLIVKLIEIAIYAAIMHVVVNVFIRLVNWFKGATSMEALGRRDRDYSPGWKSPLVEFWDRAQYQPEWLPYLEIGFIIAIIAVVWYMRPPNIKAKDAKKLAPKEKVGYKSRSARASEVAQRSAVKRRKGASKQGKGKKKR